MSINSDIKEKGPVTVARLLGVLSVTTVAVIFLLSITNAAFAQGSMEGDWGTLNTLKGDVISIDHLQNATILTLIAGQAGKSPNDKLNIVLTPDTNVKVCKADEPSKDISVKRNVTVTYHELGGIAVAERISEAC